MKVRYETLIHTEAFQKTKSYQRALAAKEARAGAYLADGLQKKVADHLDTAEFIELLVRTKRTQIFAESAIDGDGSDWSSTELSILGDIGISVPVTVYDDGGHSQPKVHEKPFDATLLFVSGALLRNDRGKTPADWNEVTTGGRIDPQAYTSLYERRLLPAFLYANSIARLNDQQALITIPGIGCGQFAGSFRGTLGAELQRTILKLLKKYSSHFTNIKVVYYDPYQECDDQRIEINHISLLIRPLTKGNTGKPQLCKPREYEEQGDDFGNCRLFSFVAWDPVSWPGNDFYIGSRKTDDGVKAAATDSMAVLTGLEGAYNTRTNTYDPPGVYRNWKELILAEQIQLQVKDNLVVLSPTR